MSTMPYRVTPCIVSASSAGTVCACATPERVPRRLAAAAVARAGVERADCSGVRDVIFKVPMFFEEANAARGQRLDRLHRSPMARHPGYAGSVGYPRIDGPSLCDTIMTSGLQIIDSFVAGRPRGWRCTGSGPTPRPALVWVRCGRCGLGLRTDPDGFVASEQRQ